MVRFEEEKWSLVKRQILWNAYILLWRRLLLLRFRMTFALFGLFCSSFAEFLASFQYWFKSLLFIFITGSCFENRSSIVLLELFHLIFFAWQFTGCYMMQNLGVGNHKMDYKKVITNTNHWDWIFQVVLQYFCLEFWEVLVMETCFIKVRNLPVLGWFVGAC